MWVVFRPFQIYFFCDLFDVHLTCNQLKQSYPQFETSQLMTMVIQTEPELEEECCSELSSDDEDGNDNSDDDDENYFPQPIPTKKRRLLLRLLGCFSAERFFVSLFVRAWLGAWRCCFWGGLSSPKQTPSFFRRHFEARFLFSRRPNFLEMTEKKLSQFSHNVRKYILS